MCSLGMYYQDDAQCNTSSIKTKKDFSKEEWKLISLRSDKMDISGVCSSHELSILTLYQNRQTVCCNPLPGRHLKKNVKGDRVISLSLRKKAKQAPHNLLLIPGKKLCRPCYSEILKQVGETEEPESSPSTSASSSQQLGSGSQQSNPDDPLFCTPPDIVIDNINSALSFIGCTPINKRKLEEDESYGDRVLKKMKTACQSIMEKAVGHKLGMAEDDTGEKDFESVLTMLKEKFVQCETRSEKVVVLSVLPKQWSITRIEEEFGPLGATNYMIRQTKDLVNTKGILVAPQPKRGKSLHEDIVKKVKDFYYKDEICSKVMPGKKDFVSVKEGSSRIHKQKRLLLLNLRELFQIFKQENHPDVDIQFSKFAQLRPKECVLAGSPGTHSVCVCLYHQNVQLMLESSGIIKATQDSEKPIKSLSDCLGFLICQEPTEACYFSQCINCPGTEQLLNLLQDLYNDSLFEEIKFQQWTPGTRSMMETVEKSCEEFTELFLSKSTDLLQHHFISKQQAAYLQEKKQNLQQDEAIVICDFAENYSPVIQSSVQSYYWTNNQITLHPFVAYLKTEDGNLDTFSYVAVTDCLKHDTVAVHTFFKRFIEQLKEKTPALKKIFVFSDGAPSQYKNQKNITNICFFSKDFPGLEIEWNFFATSHGKGPSDGIGGRLKWLVARASLQGQMIRNAEELCNWAENHEGLKHIKCDLFLISEIDENRMYLGERFIMSLPVPGIRSYHCFFPKSESQVEAKLFSKSVPTKTFLVRRLREDIPWITIKNYVIVVKDDSWRLAKVEKKEEETQTLKVKFLDPPGPSEQYQLSKDNVTTTVRKCDVLIATNISGKAKKIKLAKKVQDEAALQLTLYKEVAGVLLTSLEEQEQETEGDIDDPDSI